MPHWWSKYLNSCVASLLSETQLALGGNIPFLLDPILVDLEGGCYVGLILMGTLGDVLAGQRPSGSGGVDRSGSSSGGGSGGRTALKSQKVGALEGFARLQVCYDMHLPSLSLQDG